MATSVTYTGDGSNTSFAVPFDYLRSTDLHVYVDGVEVDFEMASSTVLETLVAPSNGTEVLIQRETDIDEPAVEFTNGGAWLASDQNSAIGQLLFGLQEVNVRLDGADVGGGGGGGGGEGEYVPTPTALNRFMVSISNGLGGYDWGIKTVAEVNAILGTTQSVPTPVSGNYFLITNSGAASYELRTPAEIRSILSVSSYQLPDPLNRSQYVLVTTNTASGYELVTPGTLRGLMGLGSAALLNTGTGVGQIPVLVTHANGPALPAVRADNLLGIAREPEFAVFEITNSATPPNMPTSWATILDNTISALVSPTSSTAYGAWASIDATSGRIQLSAGKYRVQVQTIVHQSSGGATTYDTFATRMAVYTTNVGTTSAAYHTNPLQSLTLLTNGENLPPTVCDLEGMFYTNITSYLDVQAQHNLSSLIASAVKVGRASGIRVRITVWKVG